eukprot:4587273-Pyramimonas_sp.AAC.1
MRSSCKAPAEVGSSEGLPNRSTFRLTCAGQAGPWAIDAASFARETPAPCISFKTATTSETREAAWRVDPSLRRTSRDTE